MISPLPVWVRRMLVIAFLAIAVFAARLQLQDVHNTDWSVAGDALVPYAAGSFVLACGLVALGWWRLRPGFARTSFFGGMWTLYVAAGLAAIPIGTDVGLQFSEGVQYGRVVVAPTRRVRRAMSPAS